MNARIKNLNLEKILFFDIETVPAVKDLDPTSEEFSLFQYKNRDKKSMDLPTQEETLELYKTTAALSPVYGKIVCISMGYVKGNTIYVKSLTGEEKDIIKGFYNALDKFEMSGGYNILRYDLPFTRIRAYINNIGHTVPNDFSDVDQKPWDLVARHADLMDFIKGSGYNAFSLAEACYMFGIPTPKDDISGADVARVYYSEGIERISKYCKKDVISSIRLMFKLSGQTCPENIEDRDNIVKEDIFTRINKVKSLSSKELQAEVLAEAKKLKLKKEKESFVKLIKTMLEKKSFDEHEEELFKEMLKK